MPTLLMLPLQSCIPTAFLVLRPRLLCLRVRRTPLPKHIHPLKPVVGSESDSVPGPCGPEGADRGCSACSESLPAVAFDSVACDQNVDQHDCVVPRFSELVVAAACAPRFGAHEAAANEPCVDSSSLPHLKCQGVCSPDELLFTLRVPIQGPDSSTKEVVAHVSAPVCNAVLCPECFSRERCAELHATRPRRKAFKKRKKR